MQQIIKNAIKLGNSSAVILPNNWRYKKVRIQLVEESITEDILEILLKKDLLKEVIGIYLVGSYSRGEEVEDSDIDVLVITDSVDKQIREGIYEIVLISKKNLDKNIKKSLYIISLINEAKVLFNQNFIKDYKTIKIDINDFLKKYLDEIKSVIKINREIVELNKESGENVSDGTIYSIVLRLRELYLINCLIKNKSGDKKGFLELIGNDGVYDAYLRIKNDKKTKDDSSVENVESMLMICERLINNFENGKRKKN